MFQDYNDEEVIAEPIPKIASIEVKFLTVKFLRIKITKIIEIMGGNQRELIYLYLWSIYGMNIESYDKH